MNNRIITAVLLCLLLTLMIGTAAYADNETETTAVFEQTAQEELPAEISSETDAGNIEEQPVPVIENAGEPENTQPQEEPADGETDNLTDIDKNESINAEQVEEVISEETHASGSEGQNVSSEPAKEQSGAYSLKFSLYADGGGEAEFFGGTEDGIPVNAVLKALNIQVSENSVIGYKEESVDTDVIGIKETENGLFITDKGHFNKASKPIIIVVDGVEYEIDVTDDKYYYVSESGNDENEGTQGSPLKTISAAVSRAGTEATTVKLLTNITESITIGNGQTITLDLNGMVLKGSGSTRVITNNGNLTVTDSGASTTHHFSDSSGLWVWDSDEQASAHTLSGGVITGGTNVNAGGGIYNSGTLTLKSGSIAGNNANLSGDPAYSGGGIQNSGTFNMQGGTICGNSAYTGGGLNNSRTVVMSGGTITANCHALGGGVNNGGDFTMTGGEITGNYGSEIGGIRNVYPSSNTLTLGGNARIIGNTTAIGSSVSSNIELGAGMKITVQNGFAGSVGVTAAENQIISTGAGDYAKYFSSDIDTLIVVKSGTDIKLIAKTGVVIVETSAHYDTVTEAVEAVSDGQTIMLFKDCTENISIGKTLTLDLNGHTLSASSSDSAVIYNGGNLTLISSAGSGKITGGAIGIDQAAELTLGGSVSITGNTINLMLWGGKTVGIQEGFSGQIGVSAEARPEPGEPVDITGEGCDAYLGQFTSDSSDYNVIADGTILKLSIPEPTPDSPGGTGVPEEEGQKKIVDTDSLNETGDKYPEINEKVLNIVNKTVDDLNRKLENNEISQEEYNNSIDTVQRFIDTVSQIETLMENSETSSKLVQNSLPKQAGFDLQELEEEFYLRQLELLLETEDGILNLEKFRETEAKILEAVETYVTQMEEISLMLRDCTGTDMTAMIGQFVKSLSVKTYPDFDRAAADEEFAAAAYTTIMLNLQGQVKASVTDEYNKTLQQNQLTGTARTELDETYAKEMAAIEDIETFEIMVMEVMRQKYVGILNEQLKSGAITQDRYNGLIADAQDVETFAPVYKAIFRSWALQEENDYGVTLNDLTHAAISAAKEAIAPVSYKNELTDADIFAIIVFAGAALAVGGAYALSSVLKTRKREII